MRDFANFGNRGWCAIRLFWETRPLRDCTWPGNGPVGRKTIPLTWETWKVRDFTNLEIVDGARFLVAGKRNRGACNDFAYLENVAGARFR